MPAPTFDRTSLVNNWQIIGAVLLLLIGLTQFIWDTAAHGFNAISLVLLLVSTSVATKLVLAGLRI